MIPSGASILASARVLCRVPASARRLPPCSFPSPPATRRWSHFSYCTRCARSHSLPGGGRPPQRPVRLCGMARATERWQLTFRGHTTIVHPFRDEIARCAPRVYQPLFLWNYGVYPKSYTPKILLMQNCLCEGLFKPHQACYLYHRCQACYFSYSLKIPPLPDFYCMKSTFVLTVLLLALVGPRGLCAVA